MTELKPCPFCGGTKLFVGTIADCKMQNSDHPDYKYNSQAYIVCCSCLNGGCGASTGRGNKTEAAAIEAWNRRDDNG